ncbi:MAG: hypothetical protein AB1489_39990, partial [Acidobacteriota bacterium]
MSDSQEQFHSTFLDVLTSPARSKQFTDQEDIYGWLIGSWEATVYDYPVDGTVHENKGEWHFVWVLEGRAVQDVWISPPRAQRNSSISKIRNRYGTTLRVYDTSINAWRLTWINPISGAHDELIGRRKGKDIVQEGRDLNGNPMRWVFTEITANTFRWYGER